MSDKAAEDAPSEPVIGQLPQIPRQLDPVAPVFFVSHASRYDRDIGGERVAEPNALFTTFFRDLSQDLNQLVARRSGADPGFNDRINLRAGSPWEPDILNAIGTCQVLVALVSASYSKSTWCGMEWDAFTRRQTWRRTDGARMPYPTSVLPVLWTVDQQQDYPEIVMRHHPFRPRSTVRLPLEKLYLSMGVYGMYQAEREAYRATVWRLAQEIERLVREYWVQPLIPKESSTLTNAFAEETASARDETGSAPYFFLSYAHTAPLEGADSEPTDYWVEAVFDDLCAAVRRVGRLGPDQPVGFFDGMLKPGEDWNARVTTELGSANVFVPLYSPRYFNMTWPGREWGCFSNRLAEDTAEELSAHTVPVLWAPAADALGPSGRPDPLALVDDVPEYAENGLRALRMLSNLSEDYHQVVNRLAEHIVSAARERPLAKSAVTPIERTPSAFHYKGVEHDFVVVVAAPSRETVPAGHSARWYGESGTDWRPFGALHSARLADYTLAVAERLSFNTSVLDARDAADDDFAAPGIVLIDPWIADPAEKTESDVLKDLRALYARVEPRRWLLPVPVLNAEDPESAAGQQVLAERIQRILNEVEAPSARILNSGGDLAISFGAFAGAIPALVAEAERRYLRYSTDFSNGPSGSGRPSPVDVSRPHDTDGLELPDGSEA